MSMSLKAFAITTVCLLVVVGCATDHQPRVVIVVETEATMPPGDTLFLAGNTEAIGSWRPDGVPLTTRDSTTWRAETEAPRGTRLEFKITRGTWISEAVNADGSVPQNHTALVNRDTTIHVTVADWKDISGVSTGQVTGEVEYLRALEGAGIPPRDVIVRLPRGYSEHLDRRYPVLYVHDGQNIFDPVTSYTGVDWQIDEHVDSLSRKGQMEDIIVVGIYNTQERRREYDDTDAGKAYLDFIVGTLKPMIDSRYRTRPDARHTAVMGSSMGGTISFLALWYHPHVFSMAACLSPYFPPGLPDRVSERGWSTDGLSIYIDNGEDALDSRLQTGVDSMLQVLRRVGFQDGDNLMWYRASGAAHNEQAWADRVWRPLIFMFGDATASISR